MSIEISQSNKGRKKGNSILSSYHRKRRNFKANNIGFEFRLDNPSRVSIPRAGRIRHKQESQ